MNNYCSFLPNKQVEAVWGRRPVSAGSFGNTFKKQIFNKSKTYTLRSYSEHYLDLSSSHISALWTLQTRTNLSILEFFFSPDIFLFLENPNPRKFLENNSRFPSLRIWVLEDPNSIFEAPRYTFKNYFLFSSDFDDLTWTFHSAKARKASIKRTSNKFLIRC